MYISLTIGNIPFLISFVIIIALNIIKFNAEIKNAQKHPLLRSSIQFAIFYVTVSVKNGQILETESTIALVDFLILLSSILLYLSSAIQVLTFVLLLIRYKKSDNSQSITLSSLPKPLSYQYRSLVSVFRENNSDKRTYLQRLKVIIIPAVTFTFMYFIYGVYETYFANMSEWKFIFMDILPPSLMILAILILLSFGAAYFIKGKNLDFIAMIFTALCVISYIQNAFLNVSTFINGAQENASAALTIINLLLWLGIIVLVPYIIYCCYNKSMKNILRICSAATGLLLIMQGSALSYMMINGLSEKQSREKTGYTLSGAEQYEVSSNENVIVFIMDTYYSGFFDEWLENHPEYYDTLSDFIYFDDVNSEILHTALSMPSLLTAHETDYTISLIESNKNCWNSDEANFFYSSMHDDGYAVRLYTDSDKYSGGAENMLGKIDNVCEYTAVYTSKKIPTYFSLARLSAYKFLPLSLKNVFYVTDSYLVNQYTTSDSATANIDLSDWEQSPQSSKSRGIDFYNFDYYNSLKNGLSTTNKKLCIFQHIHGMHTPYISVHRNFVEPRADIDMNVAQEGCMEIFTNYISQLKEIGVYDNSTIILTADHGMPLSIYTGSPIMLVKPQGRTNDRLTINSAPGNLQTDLLPTILDSIGLEHEPLEYSLMEMDENMQRERTLRILGYSFDYPDVPKCEAIGSSQHNSFDEYKYTGRYSETDFNSIEPTKYPITDYWW